MSVIKDYQPRIGVRYHQKGLQEFGGQAKGVAHFKYDFSLDGGAVGIIVLSVNSGLPANAIIKDFILNPIIAVTSGGATTLAWGMTAGGSATCFLAATGKASFTADAIVQGIPTEGTVSSYVKLSASGSIQLTVGVSPITAGLIEGWAEFVVAANP